METQNRGMELALFLTLPATVALVACGTPIVAALFQSGQFTAADTAQCAQVLAAFSLGLPAYILVKVLTPGFYARHDTRTPVRFAMWSILVNLVLNLALIVPLQQMAPALATAVASWVNVALLYRSLRKRGHLVPDEQLFRRTVRLALAAVVMGVAIWLAGDALGRYTTGDRLTRTLAMIALVSGGALVYLTAAFGLRAYRLSDLKTLIRRRPAS
jgi:putative peptidoglycan lipid II flippase